MLAQSTRLGPYEIINCVGAGGMGEVYRARDTRLDRIVALKVLAPELAADPRFRARLEREAKVISRLSHPNICVLHDVGESEIAGETGDDGLPQQIRYIVMEYVEGETLSGRLARGPLPLAQVLRYGAEIASALDKAHRSGITHRDVKPGNVILTKTGAKLLDFGIARHGEKSSPDPDVAARTETIPITGEGTVLGTYQYMAPEQLAALGTDARTDIFALGSLLYEMTTGRPAFSGATRTSVIAAILTANPRPMHDLQPITPPALEQIVRRCLEKEPDDRWQSAYDVKMQLDWIASGDTGSGGAPSARPSRARIALLAAAVGAVALLLGAAAGRWLRNAPAPTRVTAEILPPDGQRYMPAGNSGGPAAISPDGKWIVYAAGSLDKSGLWIRSVATGVSRKVPDAEGAIFPFWSPDSRKFAFFGRNGTLRRIDVDGDVSFEIAPARNGRGGTWNRAGTILFTPDVQTGLFAVPDRGGVPKPVTVLANDQSTHRWPAFLADGNHFVFYAADHRDPAGSAAGLFVASLDDPTPRLLLHGASNAAAAGGRIYFAREHVLYAQKISTGGTLAGDPELVAHDVMFDGDVWRSAFSVSESGELVYYSGALSLVAELVWVDRSGHAGAVIGKPQKYWEVALSPDGRRAAVSAGDPLRQLWIEDLERGTRTPLTLDFKWTGAPVWTSDGDSLYFTAVDGPTSIILRRNLTSGAQTEILRHEGLLWPAALSGEDRTLIVANDTKRDVVRVATDGTGKIEPLLANPQAKEIEPVATSDGRWIAYSSDESGRFEVYVIDAKSALTKHQISTAGGSHPSWRPDDRELYYIATSGELVAVPVTHSGSDVQFGAPQTLFDMRTLIGLSTARAYAATRDGSRFLLVRPLDPGAPALHLVTGVR